MIRFEILLPLFYNDRSPIEPEKFLETDDDLNPNLRARIRARVGTMTLATVRLVFAIAGLYDFLIGLAFLLFGAEIFERAGVPPPNHWAYVHFSALLLIVFGTAFFAVAFDPIANRNLILYGILLKISYVGIVVYYTMTSGCPMLFKPFAVIDAAMLVLFLVAQRTRLTNTPTA